MRQDYPGEWRVVLIDDRSVDGTGPLARAIGDTRLTVVDGEPLPPGWVGKVWAMAQGAEHAGAATYLLLTDADIEHEAGSLRRLVAESEAEELAMNSRMARLNTASWPERLLIPPFLFFFNLLYPMRLINRSGPTAGAAGGCILLRCDALRRAGGFAAIKGEVIDDVRLARAVKQHGVRIHLSVSRSTVRSRREYRSVGAVWRMVRRTAFTELRYSWGRLAGTLVGLALLFAVPPVLVVVAVAAGGLGVGWRIWLGVLGAAAWGIMTALLVPAERLYGIGPGWALTFPLGAMLYAAMTADSAVRHAVRRQPVW
jgi:hopene-associated glycosyltransferase HpnB